MHLLALHAIARGGDGLAPELLTLLVSRNAIATDPKIFPLRSFNPAVPDVAGGFAGRPTRAAPDLPTDTADGTPEPASAR